MAQNQSLVGSIDLSALNGVQINTTVNGKRSIVIPVDTNPAIFIGAMDKGGHIYMDIEVRESPEAKYGNTPSAFAALAYDCVMMYKAAIEAAGSADPVEVRDALAADGVVYDCITGTYSLDETGTPVKGASIIAFEAGTGADGKPAVVSKLLDVVTELPQA